MDSKLKAMINILLNEDTSIKQTKKKKYWIKKRLVMKGFTLTHPVLRLFIVKMKSQVN